MNVPRNVLEGWIMLVVDDEEDSLDVAKRLLVHYGAETLLASDGEQALMLAKTHQPRVIISDLSMPGMDGWGLLEALRAEPNTADIPIIALTAHAMVGDRERALKAGFNNYLTKPLIPKTFIADLLNVLNGIPSLAVHLVDQEN